MPETRSGKRGRTGATYGPSLTEQCTDLAKGLRAPREVNLLSLPPYVRAHILRESHLHEMPGTSQSIRLRDRETSLTVGRGSANV